MTCDCEIEQEFEKALDNFIEEWIDKEQIKTEHFMYAFIGRAKLMACIHHDCYFHMMGQLSDMLHDQIKEMFSDTKNNNKE
jgi:hypothetical protein